MVALSQPGDPGPARRRHGHGRRRLGGGRRRRHPALGWERLESEHCPLINLSQPALTQHACRVYGSLCTPHDLWGFTCYGHGLAIGDILMLPAQGAYVQTLAQRFIKPVCQTVYLDSEGVMNRIQAAETLADRYPHLDP